eukprot:1177617-Prorocentrum_minimum.AAC.3
MQRDSVRAAGLVGDSVPHEGAIDGHDVGEVGPHHVLRELHEDLCHGGGPRGLREDHLACGAGPQGYGMTSRGEDGQPWDGGDWATKKRVCQ